MRNGNGNLTGKNNNATTKKARLQEQYNHKEARLLSREEKEDKLRQEKKEFLLDLLRQGKTAGEGESMM